MEQSANWYLRAAKELADTSARQAEWCLGVSQDTQILELLSTLPLPARQPSLLFAVARFLGAPQRDYPEWASWVTTHWKKLATELPHRRVQTNEVSRTAPLMVALSRISGTISLIEIGAAAGLCLFPDHYRYRITTPEAVFSLGNGNPELALRVDDISLSPKTLPNIRFRAGIDLAPLSLHNPEDLRWLASSFPPDNQKRAERLAAAIQTVQHSPPVVCAGDALAILPKLVHSAPAGTKVVIVSLGTAIYLPPVDRSRLLAKVHSLGAQLVSFEAENALPEVAKQLQLSGAKAKKRFLLALDAEVLASGTPHGETLFAEPSARRT